MNRVHFAIEWAIWGRKRMEYGWSNRKEATYFGVVCFRIYQSHPNVV